MAKRPDDKLIWMDKSDVFMERALFVARWINSMNTVAYVPDYGDGINMSTLVNISVRHLSKVLDTLSAEQLADLEKQYVYHKTHKTETTSVRLAKPTALVIDEISKWLAEHTEVHHVYHGENPNRKLVIIFAVYHLYGIASNHATYPPIDLQFLQYNN